MCPSTIAVPNAYNLGVFGFEGLCDRFDFWETDLFAVAREEGRKVELFALDRVAHCVRIDHLTIETSIITVSQMLF